MKTFLAATVLGLTVVVPASAADLVQPRKDKVPASGQYVPVSLDGYARHRVGAAFSDKHVTIRGIPFDLVDREGADNLFLQSAGWPDWKEDPSSYYAAYDKGPETPGDPRRPIFKIPVADYTAVYVLAAADKDTSLSNVVSFRIGALDGPRRTTLHDFSAEVPRLDSQRAPAGSTAVPTKAGNLFLVRVPLGKAFAQDFRDEWAFDVEVTKELRLAIRRPDPCRFQIRPLGVPSGVHLFGMTFQRSPMQMEVSSDQAGHVFNEPQRPTFHVRLHNIGRRGAVAIEATATDYYGQTTVVRADDLASKPGRHLVHEIVLPVKRRGYHELTVRVLRGRSELLRRETTFAVLPPGAKTKRFLVSPLEKLAEWQVETDRDPELEWFNFECPRRKGDFAWREVAKFEGEKSVLEVKPKLPVPGSPWRPMYSVLAHRQGVEIPGEPTEIGLMVNGNGGWGRVIFELEDADGQRWTSIGAAARGEATRWMQDWMSQEELARLKTTSVGDWNTNDPWQRSRINFEGWRYVRFPLPGQYPGEGYHWPYSSQWKHSGDGVVRYPLTFKRLVVEIPEKVLYLNDTITVARPEVYLKDLMVTYEAPEKAFVAE